MRVEENKNVSKQNEIMKKKVSTEAKEHFGFQIWSRCLQNCVKER